MKKITALVSVLCLLSGCGLQGGEPSFFMEISFQEEESSEDSNGQGVTLRIMDDRVSYSWDYWGYHPDEDFKTHRSTNFKLSEEELLELKEMIELEQLWISIQEEQDSSKMGDSIDVDYYAMDEEREVTSSVSGMTWTFDEREGNINSKEFINSVEEVINYIEDQIDD